MGRPGRMQRARARYHPRHQHLATLMAEVAIGEAHAGHRAAKTALIVLVEVEARLERKPLDRSADRLSPNLQCIAGQPHVAGRTRARELYRTNRAAIVEHPAGAAGTVKTGEGEYLAGDELAGFIGRHWPGHRGRGH